MGAILDKYKASGNLVLHIPFRKGTLLDDSGNGNNAAASGAPAWKTCDRGRGVGHTTATSYLTVTDNGAAPELQLTSGFLYWFGEKLTTVNSTMRFLAKSDAGGNDYDLFCSDTSIQFFAGGVTSSLSATIYGKRFFAVRFMAGQKPTFFIDGVMVGDGNNAVTATANDADLIINNYYSGAVGRVNPNACLDVGIINTTTITNQEIAQLYDELMAERGALTLPTNNFIYSTPNDTTGKCVLHWDMSTKTGNGKMLDRSGNGRYGTISRAHLGSGMFDKCLQFNGVDASNVSLASGYTNTISGNDAHAVSFWVNPALITNQPVLFGNAATYYIEISNTGQLFWRVGNASVPVYNSAFPVLNRWYHVYVEKTGTSTGNAYVDNVLQTKASGTFDATPTAAGSILQIGSYAGGAGFGLLGAMDNVKVFSSNLTAAERTKEYQDGAKLLRLRQSVQDVPVTLANITVGYIPGTDVEVASGSFKISQDSAGKRWLEAATAGTSIASIISTKAYGTWLFELYKTAGTTTDILFAASAKGVGKAGAQTGYLLDLTSGDRIQLQKTVAGTVSDIAYTAASYITTPGAYRIAVTRNVFGSFSIYVKGGSFTNWTLITMTGGNPVTDAAITSSKYMVFAFSNGDKIRGIYELEGVINPTINPELIPN